MEHSILNMTAKLLRIYTQYIRQNKYLKIPLPLIKTEWYIKGIFR
jgi:hypothetical protein